MRVRAWVLSAVLLATVGHPTHADDRPLAAEILLKGGTLIDGTGSPRRQADVAIVGSRIVAVGTFKTDPKAKIVDCAGLIVAPGFIDLHTHSDEPILKPKTRSNLNYQTQGVTTIVTGNCGSGALNVAHYLDAIDDHGAGTNVIHLVPLGTVRNSVMGNDERAPNAEELATMKRLVDRGMREGAWGVSTGLIYVPGRYAERDELVALAHMAATHGGFYASHMRDESDGLLGSIDEALAIGKQASLPVHLSHLKASGRANWGLTSQACEKIAAARLAGQAVTADQYPYIASSTKLGAMVVPHWALKGSAAEFGRIADDPNLGRLLRLEIQGELNRQDQGASIRISAGGGRPTRIGRDLVTIARQEGTTPVELVVAIERTGGAQAISFGMSEDDVREVMRHDFVATASDASAHLPGGGDKPHPRAYGTFPRKVRYALENQVITLEEAIRSATGLPASILHLPDRGVVRPGAIADLVVFNPRTFRDAATFDKPTRYAPGVHDLFINGRAVILDGKPTKVLAGHALRLQKDGPADMVLTAGRIWTGDPENPWAEAVSSRSGEIIAVGRRADVLKTAGPTALILDRPETFALPGLTDAHAHLAALGAGMEEIDLRGASTPEEALRRVQERIKETPGDGWIIGHGWDQTRWPGGEFPNVKPLDAIAPTRPVMLERIDGHALWVNSEALRRAQIGPKTKTPTGGQILRDDSGTPSGILIDAATELIDRVVPSPSRTDLVRRLLAAQALVLSAGLAGVHDAGITPLETEVYRDLDREGKLKLRVYAMASLPKSGEPTLLKQWPLLTRPGGRFTLRAVKVFMDGALGSRGALLFEPYRDDPTNSGLELIPPERLEALTTEALKHGWQVCTHAIGDRANAEVLDAYARALKVVPSAKDARLRIEHAQVVRKEDLPRFKTLGVIASMQPVHLSDDLRWANDRLGPERAAGAYAWRWFANAGVPLAFGSDFPVAEVNPFPGLHAAISREDRDGQPPGGWHPEQKLKLDEALRGFTSGAAYARFAETSLGVLKTGMRADLTVIDRDPFRLPASDLLKTKVILTIVDGEIVFGKP